MSQRVLTEQGQSISFEFDGKKVKFIVLTLSQTFWVGETTNNIVTTVTDLTKDCEIDDSFGKGKIVSRDVSVQNNQSYETVVTEFKRKPDDEGDDCTIGGFPLDELEDYKDSTSFSKDKDSVSITRSMSIKTKSSKCEEKKSSPSSGSGSASTDAAVSSLLKAVDDFSAMSSADSDFQEFISEINSSSCDDSVSSSTSENIDSVNCSSSISKTWTKSLSEDVAEKGCSTSRTSTVSFDDDGLVSISVSGSFKGVKEDYNCQNGRKISIKKTKYDYATECAAGLNIRAEILEEYPGQAPVDSCEDVCVALRLQSTSTTRCPEEGTISWSGSASEVKVNNPNTDSVDSKVRDKTSRSGCINSTTRSFEISTPVKQEGNNSRRQPIYIKGNCPDPEEGGDDAETAREILLTGLSNIDFNPPGGMFGPLSVSVSMSPSAGTLSGSVNFNDDEANDPSKKPPDSLIKSGKTTTKVCPAKENKNEIPLACGGQVIQSSLSSPGYTQICKDVEFYECATVDEMISELTQNASNAAVITEDNINISVSSGSKTGSSCLSFHTEQDLTGGCNS